MQEPVPPKLYKYQSISLQSHTLDNLRDCQLWFSKPSGLNDPFDLSISSQYSMTDDELIEFHGRFLDTLRKQGKLEDIAKQRLRYFIDGKPKPELRSVVTDTVRARDQQWRTEHAQWGIACFAEEFNNILMWSHYANGHRGLCLEFDTNFFPFVERKKLHKVIYDHTYPVLPITEIIDKPDELIKPLITKFETWVYEQEWRIIFTNGDSVIHYDPKALTAIYFGCSMPDDQKKRIAEIPTISTTRLYQMKRSDTKFELEAVPYGS